MSLADELLADFDDDGPEDDMGPNPIQPTPASGFKVPHPPATSSFYAHPSEGDIDFADDEDSPMDVDTVSASSIRSIARLRDSTDLNRIIEEIEKRIVDGTQGLKSKDQIDGPIESHPEYILIVEANNMSVSIENELSIIHKFVKERYNKRFPEIESLIPTPLEYIRTVKELGNDLSGAKNNPSLSDILTQATIMILTVTASTTVGKVLTASELQVVIEACDMAIELVKMKTTIMSFVESQMSFIAPNLSVIVGSNIAAKLMGRAGGLNNLSRMPSCNLEILGNQKKSLAGFSSSATLPHTGFVYYSEIVQSCPPDLRRKATRLVGNKCAIVARVDACHSSPDGSVGRSYREQIERTMDKLMEPPPVKNVKALPAPIDAPGKKRGGKRVRRQKERMAMTEYQKAANRLTFGEIEDDAYQADLSFSSGTMGKQGGKGRIRAPQIDEKTKVRISKTLQKNLQKQQVFGGTTTIRKQVAGTASSVAFTPLQGLEIVNPQAAEAKVNEANAKYFCSTSGFHVAGKKT